MDRRSLIEQHLGLVSEAGRRVARRIGKPDLLDDLVGFGHEGLVDAAHKFDPRFGVPFEVYAFRRITGAMYDGLRRTGWVPRGRYARVREGEAAMDYLSVARGAGDGGGTLRDGCARVEEVLSDLAVVVLVADYAEAARGLWADEGEVEGEEVAHRKALAARLDRALEVLNPRERAVVEAYYFRDEPVAEAGRRLGLSRSWTARLHRAAIEKLRAHLNHEPDAAGADRKGSSPSPVTRDRSRPVSAGVRGWQDRPGTTRFLARLVAWFSPFFPGAPRPVPLLAAGALVLAAGCYRDLRTGLTPDEADGVAAALEGRGVAARIVPDDAPGGAGDRGALTVRVPAGDVARSRVILQEAGLPPPRIPGLLELAPSCGLVPHRPTEDARLLLAHAGEVARVLLRLEGVTDARVLLAPAPLPAGAQGGRSVGPAATRASVLLTCASSPAAPAGPPACPFPDSDVRRIVAGAVAGLEPDAVEVVRTGPKVRGPRGAPGSGLVSLGPWSVSPAGRGPLLALLVGLSTAVLLLSSVVVVLVLPRLRPGPRPAGRLLA